MPYLPGGNLTNASGDRLLDSSSNPITEQGIAVHVGPGNFLLSTLAAAGAGFWGTLAEEIIAGVVGAILGGGGNTNTDLAEELSLIRYDLENEQGVISPLLELLNYITSSHEINLQTILTELGNISAGGLTTEEHNQLMALVNADLSGVPDDVWGKVLSVDDLNLSLGGLDAAQVMANLWDGIMAWLGWHGIPLPDNPHFSFVARSPADLRGLMGNYEAPSGYESVPKLDLSTVVEGDTVWSWVNREYPGYNWQTNMPASSTGAAGVWIPQDILEPTRGFRLNLTDADIKLVDVAYNPPDVTVIVPPVIQPDTEPVLGTPVAIAEAVQIDAPMAGVLIDVTDVGSGVRRYPVGDFDMLYKAGYLAFINPLGYVEEPQFLSFTKGIYTPKTCTEAIGVLVKPNQGQEGTITPFTLVAP